MEFSIVSSSPKAKEVSKNPVLPGRTKYPFGQLDSGQSFTIALKDAKVKSLQALCKYHSCNNKRYSIIMHEDLQLIEIARIE